VYWGAVRERVVGGLNTGCDLQLSQVRSNSQISLLPLRLGFLVSVVYLVDCFHCSLQFLCAYVFSYVVRNM